MDQISCTLSHAGSDVRCAVCGQGFLVFWSRLSAIEQNACRRIIQDHLRDHHIITRDKFGDRRIHPRENFPVSIRAGLEQLSPSEERDSMVGVA